MARRRGAGDDGAAGVVRGRAPIVFAGALQAELLRALGARSAHRRRASRRLGTRSARRGRAAIVAMEARCSPSEVTSPCSARRRRDSSCRGAKPRSAATPRARAVAGPAGAARGASSASVAAGAVCARAGRGTRDRGAGASLAARVQRADGTGRRVRRPRTCRRRARHLSPTGIAHTRVPTLNTRERVRLETALGA